MPNFTVIKSAVLLVWGLTGYFQHTSTIKPPLLKICVYEFSTSLHSYLWSLRAEMRTPAQRHYPTMRQATQHRQWTSYRTAGSLKKCMARAHHQIPPARQHQTARPPTNTNRRKAGPEVKKPKQPPQQTQKGIEPDWKQEPRPRMQPFFSCRTRVPNFREIKKNKMQ